MIVVRSAALSDAPRLLEIYDYYVKNTAVSFEYETPSPAEFEGRMKKTMERYPYLVVLKDGRIEGYAYAGPFVGRAAYAWSCELTVYLDRRAQKCGLGRILYEALEKALSDMGILNLYAVSLILKRKIRILQKTAPAFMPTWAFRRWGNFINAGINSAAGIT